MFNYVVREKVNPRSLDDPRKFYAIAKTARVVDVREIASQISVETSLGTPDVLAVLESLLINIPKNLKHGHIVKFRDFGTFKLNISSEGAATPEEFNESMIKKTKIIFQADPLFTDTLIRLEFHKVV